MNGGVPMPRRGRFTAEDVLALRQDGRRPELIAGRLVISPAPVPGHRTVAARLARILDDAAPAGYGAAQHVTVAVGAELLMPAVTVARTTGLADLDPLLEPADVLAVAEIISPGKSEFEVDWKPALYAKAGLATYVQIEPLGLGRPLIEVFRLDADGRYRSIAQAAAGSRLKLSDPLPVAFDPAVLTAPGVSRTPGRTRSLSP
jgi:Uma2 family endonuclease